MTGGVAFCHGLHAGPWGTKIRALAAVAEGRGCQVASADCRGAEDLSERVERLAAVARPLPRPLALVGSSLGAWTAAAASPRLRPDLLFLMAPAFHMEGLPDPEPRPEAGHVVIIHGWGDDVVPVDNALRFARRYAAETHLFDDGHRLIESLGPIGEILRDSLARLPAG